MLDTGALLAAGWLAGVLEAGALLAGWLAVPGLPPVISLPPQPARASASESARARASSLVNRCFMISTFFFV